MQVNAEISGFTHTLLCAHSPAGTGFYGSPERKARRKLKGIRAQIRCLPEQQWRSNDVLRGRVMATERAQGRFL